MIKVARALPALSLIAALSSCGGGGSMTAAAPGDGRQKSSDWAANACKTFPADAASKAAGFAVAHTESPGETGSELTLVSSCSYSSADSKNVFTVLLRQDKSDPTPVEKQIVDMKSQPDVTGPSEDVTMAKGRAIWAPKIRTLSYIPADGRMIVVTPPGAIMFGDASAEPDGLKAKAIAIATAVEG